ncbi:MAG: hypothetical protein ACKO96_10455, partial [Flammeovirgaceae bacterium]
IDEYEHIGYPHQIQKGHNWEKMVEKVQLYIKVFLFFNPRNLTGATEHLLGIKKLHITTSGQGLLTLIQSNLQIAKELKKQLLLKRS